MPLSKEEKIMIVEHLRDEMKSATSIVLSNHQAIDVFSITELRNDLREKGIKFKIIKNTLLRIAAKEAGLEDLTRNLSGSSAIALTQEEPILPIKLLHKYSQDNKEKLELKIAFLEGRFYSGEQLSKIAALPGKEELIVNMLGRIKSPINSTVYCLKSLLLGLAYAVDQIHKNKLESE